MWSGGARLVPVPLFCPRKGGENMGWMSPLISLGEGEIQGWLIPWVGSGATERGDTGMEWPTSVTQSGQGRGRYWAGWGWVDTWYPQSKQAALLCPIPPPPGITQKLLRAVPQEGVSPGPCACPGARPMTASQTRGAAKATRHLGPMVTPTSWPKELKIPFPEGYSSGREGV